MIKICCLSHTAELNGAELMLLQTLERIHMQNFRPFLIVPQMGLLLTEAQKLGIETEVVPSKWWLTEKGKMWKQPFAWAWNIRAVLRLVRKIRNERIDLVLSNSSASFTGALAAKLSQVPHVWFIHEILGGKNPQLCSILGQKALARFITRFSCRVLVNSRASESFFVHKENVRLVYNGVELPARQKNKRGILRRGWGFDPQDIVIGMVGKVCEEKGQREAILALGKMGKSSAWKLLIVGKVKSKGYFKELKDICERYGLKERVVFAGFRRDVLSVLSLMDCLLVASRTESFGRTIIEAMAVKTPVIAVSAGGISEIITHGKNGFLLKSRDVEEIKNTIVSVLHNRDACKQVVNEGYRTVKEKFLLSEQVRKIEKAMEECIEFSGRNT